MPNFKSKGFSTVSIVIILLLAGGVAGGVFYYQKQISKQENQWVGREGKKPTEKEKSKKEEISDQEKDKSSQEELSEKERSFENYAISYNRVYYFDNLIRSADPKTFQELKPSTGWAKDKNYVYYKGVIKKYLDPETFEVLSYYYAADKSRVIYYDIEGIAEIDINPSNFSVLGRYIKDLNNVYYIDEKIKEVNPSFFELVDEDKEIYAKDKNNVWLYGKIIDGADAGTFKFLYNYYAKDKNNVYYRDEVIESADTETFETVVGEKIDKRQGVYGKDKVYVYYRGEIIANADPDSFVPVGAYYAKDRNDIFHGSRVLDLDIEIDLDSLSVVKMGPAGNVIKDNQRVYFQHGADDYKIVPGADPSTFQYVGMCESIERSSAGYYKDKDTVYVKDNPLNSIDAPSFQHLGLYTMFGRGSGIPYSFASAKDKNNVYVGCGDVLTNADPDSFKNLGTNYAKDKDKIWYGSTLINRADVNSFQLLDGAYAKDKNNVYYKGNIIEKADLKTFESFKIEMGSNRVDVYAEDKNYVYDKGEIIEGAKPNHCTPFLLKGCEGN